jgi:serine/threonine-protein kinase
VAALIVALAIGAAVIFAFAGGSSTDSPKTPAAADTKKQKKQKKSQKQPQAPASSQPAEPAPPPTQSAQSGYQAPQPTGNDPAAGASLNDQGFSLTQAGRYAEAVPVLERAVRAFPPGSTDVNYAYALFNLGHALRMAGRPADAVPVLEERLKNPNQRGTVQAELDAARRAAGQG